MTVYPDLAFLLGTVLHGSVLSLTLRLLGLSRSRRAILFYSVGMGACSGLLLIPQIIPAFPAVFGILITVAFFRGKTLKGTFMNFLCGMAALILYLGFVLILCGTGFGLTVVFFDSGGYFLSPFWGTLCAIIVTHFLGRICTGRYMKRRAQGELYRCRFCLNGKEISFTAYADSGNFLTEPLSGLPVVIVEFALLQRYCGKNFPKPLSYEFSKYFSTRARIIPYRSVSGGGQMLSGFVPESFTVNGIPCKAVIAVTERRLETRGRFSGIIGPDCLKGDSL